MSPWEYRAALALRLLIPMVNSAQPCGLCSQEMDPFGFHALSCGSSGCGRYARHQAVVHALADLAQAAGFGPPSRTTRSHVQCPAWSSSNRDPQLLQPADLFLIDDQFLCLDVTIVSPLSFAKSRTTDGRVLGQALLSAVRGKINKHKRACEASGKEFIPFALDTCGITDLNAWKLMSRFATRIADRQGRSYSYVANIVRRRVSFALQMGMARQRICLGVSTSDDWNSSNY